MIKRIKGVLVSSIVACLVLATAVAAQAATNNGRLAGNDRYATANQVVEQGWTSSTVAYLASGEDANLVDALTVAPLAKKDNAPVFLISPAKYNLDAVKAEMKKLGVTKVYIATGKGVISEDVAKSLGVDYEYLGGSSRYETAVNIAKKMGATDKVVVASGNDANLVDSLSVAPIAAVEGMPIVLADPAGKLDKVTSDYIQSSNVKSGVVVGGTGLVSDDVKTSINATRLAGADRYETNYKILDAYKNDPAVKFGNIYVASGADKHIVDALAAAPLAAKNASPMVLAENSVSADTLALLDGKVSSFTLLAGPTVVSDDVAKALEALKGTTIPTATLVGVDNSLMGTSIVEVSLNTANPENYNVTIKGQVAKYYASSKTFKIASDVYLEASDIDVTKDVVVTAKDAPAPTTDVKATLVGVDNSLMGTSIVEVSLNVADPENYNVTIKGQTAKYYAASQSFKIASDTYLEAADVDVTKDVVATHK